MRPSLILSTLVLSSCLSLHIQSPQSEYPISLSESIPGKQSRATGYHFREEVWVYHAFGYSAFPIGTREGLPYDRLIDAVVKKHLSPGQGVTGLKIKQESNFLTGLTTVVSLGVFAPTVVTIEGDVVNLNAQ